MDTHNPGSLSLLLISCVLSASVSIPVLAAGDGVIIIQRTVQGHMAGRSPGVDPNPVTANANPSAQVFRATSSELSDNDIAGISSGASITRTVMPGGDITGLNTLNGNGAGLGASSAAGHGGGNSLSGTINGAISRGLEPLNNIGSMVGGR